MDIYVVIGVFQGVVNEVFAYRTSESADKKEAELRKEYGLPEVKEEREEDHQENEVRYFLVDLED